MTDTPATDTSRLEAFHVNGDQVVAKVQELVHEGNVRRVIIKDGAGKTLVEFPMNLGLVGLLLAPAWMGVGAVAALAANCTILVERAED